MNLKKSLIVSAIGILLLSSLVVLPSKAQTANFEFDQSFVNITDGKIGLSFQDYQEGKDSYVNAFKIVFNKAIIAREGCSFRAEGKIYTVSYKDKEYSFWGFKTAQKKDMVTWCAIFSKYITENGKEPPKWNKINQ